MGIDYEEVVIYNSEMTYKKRNIAVVTGTRADYGILKPVIEAIDANKKLNLGVLITGQHMLKRFGSTCKEVEADGWPIIGKVRLQGENYDLRSQAVSTGRAISKYSQIFIDNNTDIVVVLGDRLEQFAAATAAISADKFLAHIHGGDRATGITDDSFRHAITKLSHVHFAASEMSAQRIKRLGEDDFRIYRTGSPAIDGILKNICRDKKVLSEYVDFDIENDFVIVLYHPAGGSEKTEQSRMADILKVMSCKSLHKMVLYPNCDQGSPGVIKAMNSYKGRKGFSIVKHLPRSIYLGLLERSKGLIGNSSGGIIEASIINVDVIDVGSRQSGRERSKSVIHSEYGTDNIEKAAQMMVRRQKRSYKYTDCDIYGDGRSGKKIASILTKIKLNDQLKLKTIVY